MFLDHLRDDLHCEKCETPLSTGDVFIKPDIPTWCIQYTGNAFCRDCAGDRKEYKRIGTSDLYAASPEVDPTDKKILAFVTNETTPDAPKITHIYYKVDDGFQKMLISDDWDVIGEMGTDDMVEYFSDIGEVAESIKETTVILAETGHDDGDDTE